MSTHDLAGQPAPSDQLLDVSALLAAYQNDQPDPSVAAQRVSFGTSGHRGTAFDRTFNEAHILAIAQAVCDYRDEAGITGPLFLGMDTHALSAPAQATCLEVFAANEIDVRIAADDGVTPTPAVSHAILTYNDGRAEGQADGVIITPSHNPPADGGIKYNGPTGGPATPTATNWIQNRANQHLDTKLADVKRIGYEQALRADTTQEYDFLRHYVDDLDAVLDMEIIRESGLSLAVDPLGGAGVHYWTAIADTYDLPLEVLRTEVDPTFSFMTLDWDGQIRMDPSSAYAMQSLINLKDEYDVAFACDTDHDRHGIVTKNGGLMPPNAYLSVMVDALLSSRTGWADDVGVGKTVVTTRLLNRIAADYGRPVTEVPVGFKWFVDVLYDGSCGFVGEESAGASFLRKDGTVWSTDKDGIIAALMAAEITARTGQDPSERYDELTEQFGNPVYERVDAPATPEQKAVLKNLTPDLVTQDELAGEPIQTIRTNAPGNDAAIGGLKVETENGWFVARPSGTEAIYKIYGESFNGRDHLNQIHEDAQALVNRAFDASPKTA
ncbi:phosphoglucomutase, alpha-D-glucose phosphate-specific [Longimonas halophila]|uniref:Phosphoglucomutase, alpha-D-glucose phosphate-specific n=1 Tax=Longimonas halophila TaxID=1469170 RepID=A0A2H3NP07_9BACT|nr:phosphoglucomutase (alpha-D-glucose-1,6-bisphosphate-dependent) [Longimonas halophila]PEN08690.1 phosphoglucomutase, alpha-D-glucose phosphate-specific [Longimonas halophila]